MVLDLPHTWEDISAEIDKLRERKENITLRKKAVVSILAVVAVAVLSGVVLWRWSTDPDQLGQFGLGGIFLASMLSHLTIVARDMFIPMFLPLATVYHPLVLGASAGIGAAIGELTTYLLGWGVAESIQEGQSDDNRLARWIRKYGLWAVLLVAVTPLPDTPIILLAGSSKLPFKKLFLVECVGKTTLYSIGAVVGGVVFTELTGAFGTIAASALMVIGSLVFCVLVSWKKSRNLIFGWFERLFL
jgi:membrane protein YqaA with SNARE-associated domain